MTRNSINGVPRYLARAPRQLSSSRTRRRALGSRDAPEFKCGSLKLLLFVTALPHSAGLSFHTFVHTFVHLHLPLFSCLPPWSAIHCAATASQLTCIVLSTASTMAVSVLGKRTRGAPDLQEQQQQQHSTRRCTRRTRSFQQDNDENEDPESTISIEAEDQSESEEVAFFSPSVTRTPSARRTKDIFKFEASDYRGLHALLLSHTSPADHFLKQLPRSP